MDIKVTKNNIIHWIIIPIIVSAFWEKLLSPAFDKFAYSFLSIGNSCIQKLSDSVYSRVSEGTYINISFYIFIILMSSILGILAATIFKSRSIYKKKLTADKAVSANTQKQEEGLIIKIIKCMQDPKNMCYFTTIGFMLLYLFFALFIFSTNFINDTITRTTNNIEIVAPYISEQEYKMLKSKFYSMESQNDYDDLYLLLDEYSSKAGVKLKK